MNEVSELDRGTSMSEEDMGRMSLETRVRVIRLASKGHFSTKILQHLENNGISVLRIALYALFRKYQETNSIEDIKRRSRPQLLSEDHYRFIDSTIADNVDMTSQQLHSAVITAYPELTSISISTIKQARLRLGCVSK